jgi:peptidoglycan hydrolase CwlO-like protein
MRVPDAHKVSYSEAVGIGDFFKRVIWNQLPRRFRALMHEVAVLNLKVHELEEKLQVFEPKIEESNAAVSGLQSKIEELYADVRKRQNLEAKVLQEIDSKIQETDGRFQKIDSKFQELENERLIAIPTMSNIVDQQALQRRLAAFQDLLPGITEKLAMFEELLRRIEEKLAGI